MTAGRLAASKPAATTNTELYRVDIESTASTVLTVANQSGSAATYRAALRDYDQILTLDGDYPSQYNFQKGNPISSYKLKITPGITFGSAVPGTDIASVNGGIAKLLDVFKDTATINRYVRVDKVYPIDTLVDNLIGILEVGETITGATSSLTGTLRAFDGVTGQMWMTTADVGAAATSVQVSRNTGLADATLLMLTSDPAIGGTEIIQIDASGINTTTNELTVTRGVYGTTASAIPAGKFAKSFIDSATVTTISEGATYAASDVTLTVTDATGFLEGSYIRIDNEILFIESVAGNDLTVTRGQYGTSDVNHNDGVTITQLTDSGDYYLNWFTEAESVSGGTSSATIDLNFSQGSTDVENNDRFIIAADSASNPYEFPLEGATVSNFDNERVYRYDQSDVSNAGHPLRLSEEQDGNQGLTGTEYTGGVVKGGTAGTDGFLEITITSATPLNLYTYAEAAVPNTPDANAGYGHSIATILIPSYQEIYIYQLRGAPWSAADTFTIGGTTYTVEANGVTPGAWGFVHDFDAARNVLKISLDGDSADFAVNDYFYDTPTIADANRVMTQIVTGKVLGVDTIGAADASRSAGDYVGLSPTGGSGTGLKVDVTVDGSGAATVTLVNGGKDYADSEVLTLTDAVLGGGGAANLTFNTNLIGTGDQAGATARTYTNMEDYIAYDVSVAANNYDKVTGIVIGPGQNLLVYSSAADLAYGVSGFETASEDYTFLLNAKSAGDGGAGTP
ncbi:tail fiber protein [Synechococcus phage S-WAM1]|uniref:Structural protein n=1 Tax=Synechococcus phage S-WAM1 TaxID=1815521 RepID=A0A1D8KS92_9CAUD|nr:tail fiber protein [Synechococcus phage S-WAM1]AOV61499.1 structural protein [Synechococcus phage S-WAM1]